MKTLYLIRHGDAVNLFDPHKDNQRTLSHKGIDEVTYLGHEFRQRSIKPDLILCSPAIRTLTTASILADLLDYPRHLIQIESIIYQKDFQEIFTLIQQLPHCVDMAFLVGHNPHLGLLAHYLTYSTFKVPTAGLIALSFAVENWEDIGILNSQLITSTLPPIHTQ